MFVWKKCSALGLAIFLSLSTNTTAAVCNCSEGYAGQYKVVTKNLPLGLRNGHSSTSTKIGTLPKGAVIDVTEANGSWAHVTYNGISGYASMQYLEKVSSVPLNNPTNNQSSSQPSVVLTSPNNNMQSISLGAVKDICTCSTAYAGKYTVATANGNLRLRSKHSSDSNSQILASMPKGTVVNVTAMGNSWAHVTYNGITGYASSEYLKRYEEATSSNVLKGDVNGDGKVDLTDLSQLELYLVKIETSLRRMDNADINSDGDVSPTDLSRLKLHLAGIEPFDSNGQPLNNQSSQSNKDSSPRPAPQQYTVVYPESGLLYSIQPKCAPDNELTVYGAAKNSGAKVVSHEKNSHWHTQPSHQKWYVTRIGNTEWYKIQAENSKLALSEDNFRAGYFADATIREYAGADQQFKFVVQTDEPNYYKIVANKGNANSNQYMLSVVNSSSGRIEQPIRIEPNNPVASGQFWRMEVRKPSFNWSSNLGKQIADINSSSYESGVNPFNKSYPDEHGIYHETNCTWYAWGRMREVTGKSIIFSVDSGRNGGNWHNLVTNCTVSNTVVAKSVGERPGHVVFVEAVEGNTVYYSEANVDYRTDLKIRTMDLGTFSSKYSWFMY